MSSKRLKIENIQNFEELNIEELSSIGGGLTLAESEMRIAPEAFPETYPRRKPKPYPLPDRDPEPYPLPHYPCSPYPTKRGKLPWCAVIL